MSRLISASDLRSLLQRGQPLRFINSTLTRPLVDQDPNYFYNQQRIPGATFLDLDVVADLTSNVPHQLPSDLEFSKHMRSLDISNKDQIVLYDDLSVNGAARMWWVFGIFGLKPMVLDGGFNQWKKAGLEIETGDPSWTHRNLSGDEYSFVSDRTRVLNYQDALTHSWLIRQGKLNNRELVDARGTARFSGEAPDPRGLRSGNIPGSKNVPFNQLLNEDGTYKSNKEIEQVWREAGVDLTKQIATTCGSGVTASTLQLSLHKIGVNADTHIVYDGSWSEFGQQEMPSDEVIENEVLPQVDLSKYKGSGYE